MISLTVSLSGIDALFYYSNKIFEAGSLAAYATFFTIGLGAVSVIFSLLGTSAIEWAGRKILAISGSFMILIALITLVSSAAADNSYGALVAIIFHMFAYNSSLGINFFILLFFKFYL